MSSQTLQAPMKLKPDHEQTPIWSQNGLELDRYPASIFRVRFQDCDPFRHLNNGRYIDYMINAREEHLREWYDFDLYSPRFAERNWLVRSSRVTYVLPVPPNQPIHIRTALLNYTRNALYMEAVLSNPESGAMYAAGWLEFRYVELGSGKPARHEPELMQFFERAAVGIEMSYDPEKTRMAAIRGEMKADSAQSVAGR